MTSEELFEALCSTSDDNQDVDLISAAIADGIDLEVIREMLDYLEQFKRAKAISQAAMERSAI